MTDELSLQQQIPQQRGSYAVPGFLTGAAIGGAAGVAGAHYKNWGITQKPDLDKVFAQEADSFTSQIEKAEGDNKSFLEAAKEETQKIKDAGSEFEKYESELKSNGKTTSVELTDELKNKKQAAQEAYDKALDDAKKNVKPSKSGGIGSFPTVENSGIAEKKQRKEYRKLRQDYMREMEAVRNGTAYQDLSRSISDDKKILNAFYEAEAKAFRTAKAANPKLKSTEFFSMLDPKGVNGKSKYYDNVRSLVEDTLRAEGTWRSENKKFKTRAHELTVEIIDASKEFAEVDEKIANYDANFKFNKKELPSLKAATLDEVLHVTKGKGVKYSVELYDSQRKALRSGSMSKRNIKKLMTKYGVKTPTELQNLLDGRYGLANRYLQGKNALELQRGSIVSRNSLIRNQIKERARLFETNKQVLAAKKAIVEKFPQFAKEVETLTDEQILAKAKEAIKDTKAATDLAAVEKEIAEFTEKNGKKVELSSEEIANALKEKFGAASKTDYEKLVKDKATERLKGLAEKAKFANKTWTGLAAAGALAVVGGLIGMATKKDEA